MKKSVFAFFIIVWCVCSVFGQNDELFRRALSERNENRWHEISDRFGKNSTEEWDRIYSSWLWRQIETRIVSPDIQRFSDKLSDQGIRLTHGAETSDDLADTLSSWRNYGQITLQTMYGDWEEAADAVFDQMTAALSGEAQTQVSAFFTDYKGKVHKELETLFLAGERRFLSSQLRTDDLISNDEKTGKKKIEEMFEEITSVSDTSLQSLQETWDSTFASGMSQWNAYADQTLGSKIDWNQLTYSQAPEGAAMNKVLDEFAETRSSWFEGLNSIIQDGKALFDGQAFSFFNEMEDTLEQTRMAFDQNAQLLQTRMDAVFAQFSTVKGIKDQASANRQSCLNEKARLENYRAELQSSVDSCNSSIASLDRKIAEKRKEIAQHERNIQIHYSMINDNTENMRLMFIREITAEIEKLNNKISGWESERTNLINRRSSLEGLIAQQNDKITVYAQQASFWDDAVSRCSTRESEIRQSMGSIEDEIRSAGWPEGADIQLYQLKSEMDVLAQNAEIAKQVYEFALDISSGKAVREEVYDAYSEAEKAMKDADNAYKDSVSALKELADNLNDENNLDQKRYLVLSDEYRKKADESKALYNQYADAVMNFRIQDRKREYILSPDSRPEDALKAFNEAEKALAMATEKYDNAVSLARQNMTSKEEEPGTGIVQAALYLNKVKETVQAEADDLYAQAVLAGKNAEDRLSDHLFSDGGSIALEFVQKMNNSLLREFSLAYYWRSLHNSGFKTIDVAIFSDQNFQKLKSYGYAFSHPEDYTTAQAQAAYNGIASSPEKLRLYTYFEESVNKGTAQFDITFIGKDVSDVAHDYLWDLSLEKERNYEKNHTIYNFFTRKSKKMRSMRKAMADIDGNKERSAIMDTVNYIRGELDAKNRYETSAESLDEDAGYTFDELMAKCRECSGLVLADDAVLEGYFNQLAPESRKGFLSILSELSSLIMKDKVYIGLEQLNGLDDYDSSSNRLVIMNLTGAELMNKYQEMAEYSVRKMAADLNMTYKELSDKAASWDVMTEHLFALAEDKWESVLENLKTEMKNRIQLETIRTESAEDEFKEEIFRHSTYLVALQMSTAVDDLENQVFSHVEKANQTADKRITDLLEGKGYVRHGSNFRRKAIIGESLLGGIEYENQNIEGYRWFCAPAFNLGVNLSPSYIEELDLVHLAALIEQAETAIDRYTMVIFGQSDSLEAASWSGFDQDLLSYMRQAEIGFRSSAQYSDYSGVKGLFAMHIGYVPVMSSTNPEKVLKKGYGEYGRIFELFYKNEGRLGRGLAAVDVPFYMQTLWDEDSNNDGRRDTMLFALPSIREGGQLVSNIFSSVNPALGVMVTAFDSITFGALDMVFAGKSFEDAAKDVNKRMVTALSSWGTGSLAQMAQPAQDAAIGTKILQTAAVSAGKGYADQVAAAAADGELIDKGLRPDAKGSLGNLVRNWISGSMSGFLGEDQIAAEQVARFAGTLTDAGYELATAGKAKFNVLNLSSFCDAHIGLLEMNIGGDGPVFEIGSRGYDISKNTVETALASAYVLKEDNRIRHSSDFSKDNKITMRALFSEGKIQDKVGELYNLLINDGASVEYENIKDALAYTSLNSQGVKNIILNSVPSGSLTDQLKKAVIIAHEAYRNGKDDGVLQILETADAVLGHAKMAYDIVSSGFRYPDIAMIKNEVESLIGGNIKNLIVNALANYVSSGDYWRIIGDGNVVWDGNLNLYQENGNILYNYLALKTALNSGVESIAGVSRERLSDIVWKNYLLEMMGTKGDGTYISKAAESILSDGYMSYGEAVDSLSDSAGKTFSVPDIFQHYSARIVANDTALLEKIFSDPDMLDKWSDRSQPVQYLDGVRATLLPDSKSVFHISPEDRATYKWVLDDGRELVIGERKDGTKYVQTDDHYLGTYNMANPDNPLEHAVKDVFPYAVLGNTPDDSSIANFLFSL